MSKLKLWSDFMSRYDIVHEHDNHKDAWPLLPAAFLECKMRGYVAIMRDYNHGLKKGSRDYKEITLFWQ